MIFQTIALLTLSLVAFAAGVKHGRLTEITKFKEAADFWLDKHAMCKQED